MAPAGEVGKIGVVQEDKMAYELADGTVREYRTVWFELNSWA
jgi:hypothetical protein